MSYNEGILPYIEIQDFTNIISPWLRITQWQFLVKFYYFLLLP